MNYGLTQKPVLKDADCLVIGLFSDEKLPDFAQSLDKEYEGLLGKLSAKTKEAGESVLQSELDGHSLILIQCGKKEEFTPQSLQKRLSELTALLLKQKYTSATLCLPQIPKYSPNWQLEQMIISIDNHCYQLLDYKKGKANPHALEALYFYLPGTEDNAINCAQAINAGVTLTRTLGNMPANICTPSYLGEEAQKLAKQFPNIHCTVLQPDEIRALGMNTLLAVAQGSDQPVRLIDIHYKGSKDKAPIVLVGKGVTYDSGGMSMKPAEAQVEMKYDMCGAASVLGTLKACALLELPIHVIGIIPSTENMVSGRSVKSGDIVTSMSGQTVEIINTDAEGRLILADALTYAERYKPEFVLDIATLTGAMIVALGNVLTGFMTEDDALAQLITAAGEESMDKVWRMPLMEAYQDAIDSPLADMLNATFDRTAGSITAACFLSRFTKKYRWAHLDIAGTAWISGKKRNATGRPVPLLTQIIRQVAHAR